MSTSSTSSTSTGAGSSAGAGAGAGMPPLAGLFTPDEAALLIDILFSAPVTFFSFLIFIYGLYTLLFVLSVYILTINQRKKGYKILHISSSCILFVLVTAFVTCKFISQGILLVNVWTSVLLPTIGGNPEDLVVAGKFQDAARWIFIFVNLAAETILIQRTFVIWNSDLKIIVLPLLLMLANAGIGIAGQFIPQANINESVLTATATHNIVFSGVFLGVNVFTNLVLTGLIAGKIWYTRYQTNKYLVRYQNDAVQPKRYSSLIAIIIESGILYPLVLILSIILSFGTFPPKDRLRITHVNGIIDDLLALVAAIAPTLIIVRAGLGLSIETLSGSRTGGIHSSNGNPQQNINPLMSLVDSISTHPESNFGFKELPLHHGSVSNSKPSRSFDSNDPNNAGSSGALGSAGFGGGGIEEVKFGYDYDGYGAGHRESGDGVPPGGLVAGPKIARLGRERSQYPSQYQPQPQSQIENSNYRTRSASDSEPRSEWSTGA